MRRRHHGNRRLDRVDPGEADGNLADAGQTFHDGLRVQVRDVQQDMILVRATATAFVDFGDHGARDHVARGEVFQVRRVAFHETLAIAVAQNAAFAAHAFGNQHARAGHAGGVELPEFHVFERNARARRHAEAVAGVDEGVGGRPENAPGTAGGENRRTGMENRHLSGFHFQRRHAQHIALCVTNQIQRHPFHEEMGMRAHVALIERVQHGVAGAVCRRARAHHRRLAVVHRMAAEGALVDFAVVRAVKRHPVVFQLNDHFVGLAAHELDGILVAQPVRPFHGVVHMPVPVVFGGIAQRSGHAALRRHGVRAGGKHLGQNRRFQSGFGKLQRRAQARAARAHNNGIISMLDHAHAPSNNRIFAAHAA